MTISTHASAREATDPADNKTTYCKISTHASAREATAIRLCETPIAAAFQLTPPHGRRHCLCRLCANFANFNSRLRTGGDCMNCSVVCCTLISTHASAREATQIFAYNGRRVFAFQLTPPHGRRRRQSTSLLILSAISTHASAREATAAISLQVVSVNISTHASAREATRYL